MGSIAYGWSCSSRVGLFVAGQCFIMGWEYWVEGMNWFLFIYFFNFLEPLLVHWIQSRQNSGQERYLRDGKEQSQVSITLSTISRRIFANFNRLLWIWLYFSLFKTFLSFTWSPLVISHPLGIGFHAVKPPSKGQRASFCAFYISWLWSQPAACSINLSNHLQS